MPIVLLIHGFGTDAATWAALIRQIDAGTEIVAIDLPGHGQSPPPDDLEETLTILGLSRVIRDFVFALRLDSHPGGLHVVGHSMGGALALAFASTFGAACRLRRLTLMAPAMTTPHPSPFLEAARRGEFCKWLTPDNPQDMAAMLENIVHTGTGQRNTKVNLAKKAFKIPGVVGALNKAFMPEDRRKFGAAVWAKFQTAFFESDRVFGEMAASGRLGGVEGMVVWGKEDRIIDVSGAEKLLEWWPEWRLEIVEDVGHAFFVERPKTVARILEDFSSGSSTNPAVGGERGGSDRA